MESLNEMQNTGFLSFCKNIMKIKEGSGNSHLVGQHVWRSEVWGWKARLWCDSESAVWACYRGILVRTGELLFTKSAGHVSRVSASTSGLPLQVGAGGGDAPGLRRGGRAVSGIQLGREESTSRNGPLHRWCHVCLWYDISFWLWNDAFKTK